MACEVVGNRGKMWCRMINFPQSYCAREVLEGVQVSKRGVHVFYEEPRFCGNFVLNRVLRRFIELSCISFPRVIARDQRVSREIATVGGVEKVEIARIGTKAKGVLKS